jgi:hypothetical protein
VKFAADGLADFTLQQFAHPFMAQIVHKILASGVWRLASGDFPKNPDPRAKTPFHNFAATFSIA